MSDLAQRYGTNRRGRRTRQWPLLLVAVVLGVAGLAWVAWTALYHGRPDVRSNLVTFDVVSEHRVEARFAVVRRDPQVRATCLLRAYAVDHSVVGELNVPVGPGGAATSTESASVRTYRAATSVELIGCNTTNQSQRR